MMRARRIATVGLLIATAIGGAAAESAAGPDATASAPVGTTAKVRKAVTRATLKMPPPHQTWVTGKSARVAKHLRAFRIKLFVRRTDGVWSSPVEIGQRARILSRKGRVYATLRYFAKYSPGLGRLKYAIRLRNEHVSRRVYRRARVTVKIEARYRH